MSNWTILYCSDKTGDFIHEKNIMRSNPNAQILKIDFSNPKYRKHVPGDRAWLEPDRIVREYLKENSANILMDNVALVEYDVLISQKLPDLTLENEFLGTRILYPDHDEWWGFFQDKNQLGILEQYSCSVILFCLYFMSKNCIDIWINSKYDFLYEPEITTLGELRLPTILRSEGVSIYEMNTELTKNIHAPKNTYFDLSVPGIYHPVKIEISLYE